MSGFGISTDEKDLSQFALAIQQLFAGRSYAIGSVTLTPSAASTTVTAPNCSYNSAVFLFPKTANAAAAVATTYWASSGKQSFTLTHANNAQADKTFWYVALG